MHGRIAGWLALTTLLLLTPALPAQSFEERPLPFVPKRAPTQKELDRRTALHHYVLGLLCQHEDRLLEALKAFEESAKLDPQAAPVFRAQIPLLVALDRGKDALAVSDKALALDAEDFETWFLAARIHKSLGQFADAQKFLERGLACRTLDDFPHIAQQMWIDLGTMHELADELAPAIKAFTAAAELLDHPDLILEHGAFNRDLIVARAAETHERLGNLYRKAKKYPEAIASFQKAQQRSTDNGGRLNFNLAQLCQEEGRHADALGYVDAYLHRQPLGTEAYEMKINLLGKLRRTDEILPWLEKASAADQYNVSLKTLLAQQCAQAKRLSQAEKLYLALVDEAPSGALYQGLFRVYQDDAAGGKRALELLDRTLDLATRKPVTAPTAHAAAQAKAMVVALREDAALSKELVRAAHRRAAPNENLHFETVQLLAALADRHDQLSEAEALFREALRAAPATAEPLLYGGLLRVLWKAKKTDDVLKVCQDGLANAKATNHVLFHTELARAQARRGRHEEALRSADRAVALAGDNDRLTLQMLRIGVLTQAERHVQAEEACLALLKEQTLPAATLELRYRLSNVYNAWKKLPQCEEQLELILKADPSNATANNDLGYIWADHNKNLERAEEMIRKALEMDRLQRRRLAGDAAKDNAAFVDSLGWVLFRRGKIEEARRELERAATLPDGDDPVIWDHLGDVYQQQMLMGQARTAWEKAVNLYEQENRRSKDDRYRELRRKLESVTAGAK